MGGDFELPKTILESAAKLYRRAYHEGFVDGRSIDGFATASIIIAVRRSSISIPVSHRELQRTTRARKHQIRNARAKMEMEFSLDVPPMEPQDFLPKATSDLSAPHTVERCAEALLDARDTDEDEVRSISPRTLAATAIYVAYDLVDCPESVTLAEISETLDMATSTISNYKNHLLEYEDAWH